MNEGDDEGAGIGDVEGDEVDRNSEADNVSNSDDSDWHSEYEDSDVLRSLLESSEDENLSLWVFL